MALKERHAGCALFHAQLHAQVAERRGISHPRLDVFRAAGSNAERACAHAGQQAGESSSARKLWRHGCFPFSVQAEYWVRPPTTVRTILMSLILAGSTVCGSSASMTKSASLPRAIDPLIASSR